MTAPPVRTLPGAPTGVAPGNYFVANYPPFSCWSTEHVAGALAAFAEPPAPGTPLGLYVHVPFCRKRCRFCYFKVYTDRNATAIERYLDAVVAEAHRYAEQPFAAGRPLAYAYVGGGTPSYLSTRQIARLVDGLRSALRWDAVEEVAFECEPGTLTEHKVRTIRDAGVTRLSLGVESLVDRVLEANGRAHLAHQAYAAYAWARAAGFPQVNLDLIAGMVEEHDEDWDATVERTVALAPDSVTIYQMEVPYNTVLHRERGVDGALPGHVPEWDVKRRRLRDAFARLEAAGYVLTSGYTAVKDPQTTRFVYRDALWHGADMIGLGVASFGHVGHAHYQNVKDLEPYVEQALAGRLPVARAVTLRPEELLVRELILQMKLGRLDAGYFERKFGVDVLARFADPLATYRDAGFLTIDGGTVTLARDALLQVDAMLGAFYLPEHRDARYT